MKQCHQLYRYWSYLKSLYIVIIYCWFSDALNLNWIKLLTTFALKFSQIRREATLWRSVIIIYVESHFHSSLPWFRSPPVRSSKSPQSYTHRSLKAYCFQLDFHDVTRVFCPSLLEFLEFWSSIGVSSIFVRFRFQFLDAFTYTELVYICKLVGPADSLVSMVSSRNHNSEVSSVRFEYWLSLGESPAS